MNDPELYTKANDLQRRRARDFSDEFSNEFGKMSGRCLDIGSGPGDVAVDVILPKLNTQASLVCSDFSEVMLKFAAEKYKGNRRLSFVKLDIETPGLPKDLVEQFDHITSFHCLHWCQNMRQVFKNIFDLLRPEGSTFLVFVANNPGINSYKRLAAMPRYQPYMKRFAPDSTMHEVVGASFERRVGEAVLFGEGLFGGCTLYNGLNEDVDRYIPVFQHSLEPRKTLKALIEDVGFEVHHCSVREMSYTFVSPDAFSRFVLSVNPFVDLIPTDLVKDFRKDLVNEFSRECIIFNKNKENQDEYSVLMLSGTFVVYLKKLLANNK